VLGPTQGIYSTSMGTQMESLNKFQGSRNVKSGLKNANGGDINKVLSNSQGGRQWYSNTHNLQGISSLTKSINYTNAGYLG